MMKVNLGQVKARIGFSVSSSGSVLAQTVQAKADKIVIHYDVESTDGPGTGGRFDAQRPQRLLCPPVLWPPRTV